MKRILISAVAFLPLAASVACAQVGETIYSRPALPTREVLDRLNLTMAWHVYVPTDGQRDGLASVEMLGQQVLIQTRRGLVVFLDADSGQTLWRTHVGRSYEVIRPPGYNASTIFVVRGTIVYFLDRGNGRIVQQLELPATAAAAPTADKTQLYILLDTGKLAAYQIVPTYQGAQPAPNGDMGMSPGADAGESARPPAHADGSGSSSAGMAGAAPPPPGGKDRQAEFKPRLVWYYRPKIWSEYTPLQTVDYLLVPGSDRSIALLSKVTGLQVFRTATDGPVTAPLAGFGDVGYAACKDRNLYAIDMNLAQPIWHFPTGTPIRLRPQVTRQDVYVTPDDDGLYRLNRLTGDVVWHSDRAARFLAVNPKFVYAADRSGRLLVLDGARGTELSSYDSHDFVVPVSNDLTDRLFLAANNGLLICLHDRQYARPFQNQKGPERKAPPKPPAKPKEDRAVGKRDDADTTASQLYKRV